MHKGAPRIFVNGTPQTSLAFWRAPRHDYRHLRDFAQLGVEIVLFTTSFSQETCVGYWPAPGRYDFSFLDETLSKTIQASPRALIIPRVSLLQPPWWGGANPSELRLREDGAPYQGRPEECLQPGQLLPSLASPKWRADTAAFLGALITHVESGPFAEHIIGYHLSSESTEEWFYLGGPDTDYSPVNAKAFRQWLKANDQQADAAHVKIPSIRSRRNPECGEFFSPATQADVIRFYAYHHWIMVDTIRYFAAVVKAKTGRRALVSVFYGYHLQPIPGGQLDSGHYALKELIECQDVDILCSPTCYEGRALGTGYSYCMSPTGSVRAHRKLWFDENDIRTHRKVPGNEGYGKTKTLAETISMQWREFGNAVCNGTAAWWMDQSGGWYDDPALLEEIGRIYEVGKRAVDLDLTSVAEIAVVIDEKSVFLRGPEKGWMTGPGFQSYNNIVDLGHIGAPVDFILLEDLPLAKPYKLYFFKYCYRVNRDILAALERIVKRGGQWAVWLDKPGFFDEDRRTLSAENAEPMTGLKIAPDFTVANAEAGLSAKLSRPARTSGGWTSVYLKNHPSAGELRRICREAGVHIYLDTGDVVYANQSLLCIHVNQGGLKTIRLPAKAGVYDLVHRVEISRGTTEFSLEMEALGTGLFLLNNRASGRRQGANQGAAT